MLFKDIIGQGEVIKRLLHSVQKNRVSHAQLFLGAEGSGALPLALAYAQYILCSDHKKEDACGVCSSCLKMNKLIHPDVHFVYPIAIKKHESEKSTDVIGEWRQAFLQNPYLSLSDWFSHLNAENKQPVIGVEESGDILRKLSLTTYEGEFKVMLVWMPEKMNAAAANKLLKILEEPPDKTLFLLVSENEEALLRTIYSRTQLIKINRIQDEEIKKALVEKKDLQPAGASKIAYLADGNYNAALKLVSEGSNQNVNLYKFRDWMRLVYKADVLNALTWVEDIGSAKTGRENQKAFLLYGLNILRECLAGMYGDRKLMRVDGEELDFVKKLSTRLDGDLCKQLSDELNEAIIHIERNGSGKLIFTDLSLKCMKIVKQMQKV